MAGRRLWHGPAEACPNRESAIRQTGRRYKSFFNNLPGQDGARKNVRPAPSDHRCRHHDRGRSALPCVVSRLQEYSLLILVQTKHRVKGIQGKSRPRGAEAARRAVRHGVPVGKTGPKCPRQDAGGPSTPSACFVGRREGIQSVSS